MSFPRRNSCCREAWGVKPELEKSLALHSWLQGVSVTLWVAPWDMPLKSVEEEQAPTWDAALCRQWFAQSSEVTVT